MNNKHTDIIAWAAQVLSQSEINSAVVVETPWSNVLKINTPWGWVYLKQTPPGLFIEVDVIQQCRALCKITDVPEVIAANKNLHCFLMKECGEASLRTMFDGELNVELLMGGLKAYRNLQKATMPHLDALVHAGVPDWRLEYFSKLYSNLVNNEEFLSSHGLNVHKIQMLKNSVQKVETLCQELLKYKISECLNHSDFHENNMVFCRETQKINIIDLGETAVNHPFFSLVAFLQTICHRYNVSFSSENYQKLHTACFEGWLDNTKNIIRVLEIIELLLPIYFLFAQKRFLDAIHLPYDIDNPMSVRQHDKVNKVLIDLKF